MSALKVTNALRRDIEKHYDLREPICNADVRAEYQNLVRCGFEKICGDFKREALRNIFAKHGADPVHG